MKIIKGRVLFPDQDKGKFKKRGSGGGQNERVKDLDGIDPVV